MKSLQTTLKISLQEHFAAVIQMLDSAINLCPEELWHSLIDPPIWQIVYHSIYYLNLYIGDSKEERSSFKIPKFDIKDKLSNLDNRGIEIISKEAINEYLTSTTKKVKAKLQDLDKINLSDITVFDWYKTNKLGMLFITLRHTQHHIGALNSILRRNNIFVETWVGKGRL